MDTTNNGGAYHAHGEDLNTRPPREGHTYLGFCCDMRRATIIVSCFSMIFSGIGLAGIGEILNGSIPNDLDQQIKDDIEYVESVSIYAIVICCVSLISAIIGLFGAVCYNEKVLIVPMIWYFINTAMAIFSSDLIGATIGGLFFYPHFVLYNEIRSGIMAPETYEREAHSCCCV